MHVTVYIVYHFSLTYFILGVLRNILEDIKEVETISVY